MQKAMKLFLNGETNLLMIDILLVGRTTFHLNLTCTPFLSWHRLHSLFDESGKGHDVMNSLEYFKLGLGRATFAYKLGCLTE